MKTLSIFISVLFFSSAVCAQVSSISFIKSADIKIEEIHAKSIDGRPIDNDRFINIQDCKYPYPNYNNLTGTGIFYFKKITRDIGTSLNALGCSFSIDRRSEFYVYYFTRSKTYSCPEHTNENRVSFGVGAYIICKISDLRSGVRLASPFDIAAAAHLNLVKVEMEVRTIGMTPELQNEFMPKDINKIDIEFAKYIEQVENAVKTKISNINTSPELLPIEKIQ